MEEEPIHPDYIKGFNDSYLLAQHLPELAEKLSAIQGNSPRLQGMREGRQQYLSEQVKAKMPSWLQEDRLSKSNPSSSPSKTRDIDPPSK
ncbi:hypothetical protein BWI96_10570 [Siphonobacter sp. SORGH_AS_0500]|uniref:hypothetical protein n=1 Tax=Siphonobacter sp. SORGH_AS_0500 TaxID=1864824 RepID=UPI000CB7704E|nr:hypothetical protein [Siphonobacter sp. SORGH_AS_0500]PKK36805.1 hypothetical protein BWI96_10570 [Siphonobacter sp. SORGH_AS_0500]